MRHRVSYPSPAKRPTRYMTDRREPCENLPDCTYNSAALCQVFDSIYMDLPMSKVKFNATGEYAYVQNFKVLQSAHPFPLACCFSF